MAQAGPPPVSADGLWFWDGSHWKSLLSADRQKYWNGTAWVPLPPWLSPSEPPAGPPASLAAPPPPPPAPAPPPPPPPAHSASGALPPPPGYAPSAPAGSTPPPQEPVAPRPSWLPADAPWPPPTFTATTSAPLTTDAPMSAPAPGAVPWANVYSDVVASSKAGRPIYAGFWIRFVAYFVDSLIVGIPISIIYFTLLGGGAAIASQDQAAIAAGAQTESLLSLVANLVYFVFFWSQGSTLGMRIVNIRVADQTTFQTIGPGKAILRYLGWIVCSICFIGFLWAAFDGRKQGWHDKIGGTVVVYR